MRSFVKTALLAAALLGGVSVAHAQISIGIGVGTGHKGLTQHLSLFEDIGEARMPAG
jgi:hypothetical protein